MIRRNYESDLEIVLTQTEALGRAEKWSILFFTGCGDSPSRYVVATREGESYKNCRPTADGGILCTFQNHGLLPGVLRCKVILETEDPDFAPALKRTVIPMDTPYRLGPWAGDDADLNISMLEIAGLLVPGPSGPKGDRGEQGDPGAPGEQGAPGPGVARGGSTGQALVKGSDSDYDTRWAEVLRADQPQQLSRSQQAQARENISSVGYLQLAATLGTEADNWPLVLTTSLGEVQAAYTQFRAAPGRYRWSLAIHSRAGGNPFVEEAELEPLHRDDGGLELQFTSKRSGKRYALVLTIADGTVTAATVEYLGNVGGEIVECIDVAAHSDCTLAERVTALEKTLIDVLSGKVQIPELQVRRLNVWCDNNLAFVGAGAPTKAPDRAGQFYVNTTDRVLYYSTGNASLADWKIA